MKSSIGRAMPALESLGRILARFFHPLLVASSLWLPELASLHLCLCPHMNMAICSVWLCLLPLALRTAVIISSPTLTWHDLFITNSICQDPVSKQGHILEVEGGHECLEDTK